MLGSRKVRHISYGTTGTILVQFNWQNMAGAGAKIIDKGGAGNK